MVIIWSSSPQFPIFPRKRTWKAAFPPCFDDLPAFTAHFQVRSLATPTTSHFLWRRRHQSAVGQRVETKGPTFRPAGRPRWIIDAYTYTCRNIYICIYVYMYIYMYVCIYIYICKRDLSVLFDGLTNPHSKKRKERSIFFIYFLRFPENKEIK